MLCKYLLPFDCLSQPIPLTKGKKDENKQINIIWYMKPRFLKNHQLYVATFTCIAEIGTAILLSRNTFSNRYGLVFLGEPVLVVTVSTAEF